MEVEVRPKRQIYSQRARNPDLKSQAAVLKPETKDPASFKAPAAPNVGTFDSRITDAFVAKPYSPRP